MKLQTRIFAGCPNLENIFLTRNAITTVEPFTFADLGNLTYLTIVGNQLVILGDYSFANIPKLKELNLFNNDIRSISTTVFVGSSAIKSIQLNSNKLSTVPYLGHQQQLGELNLQRNLIVNVTFPALFTTGSQQIGIDLSMNSIKALTNKTFISLVNANLSRLYLSDNKISDVDPGAFSGITSVSTLRFKGNPLT